jgi:hypothetical protein
MVVMLVAGERVAGAAMVVVAVVVSRERARE